MTTRRIGPCSPPGAPPGSCRCLRLREQRCQLNDEWLRCLSGMPCQPYTLDHGEPRGRAQHFGDERHTTYLGPTVESGVLGRQYKHIRLRDNVTTAPCEIAPHAENLPVSLLGGSIREGYVPAASRPADATCAASDSKVYFKHIPTSRLWRLPLPEPRSTFPRSSGDPRRALIHVPDHTRLSRDLGVCTTQSSRC